MKSELDEALIWINGKLKPLEAFDKCITDVGIGRRDILREFRDLINYLKNNAEEHKVAREGCGKLVGEDCGEDAYCGDSNVCLCKDCSEKIEKEKESEK